MKNCQSKRTAFTLIELLVVVAISAKTTSGSIRVKELFAVFSNETFLFIVVLIFSILPYFIIYYFFKNVLPESAGPELSVL